MLDFGCFKDGMRWISGVRSLAVSLCGLKRLSDFANPIVGEF